MPIRLDLLVSRKFNLSRRKAEDAVRNGRIDLGDVTCDEPGCLVDELAEVVYVPHRPKARRVLHSPIVRLYEDRHLLVVDKPPGVLTLPTANHELDTLLDRAKRYLSIRFGRPDPYVGVIHRLDRETSGAIAFARTPESLKAFQTLFHDHEVERRYLAVVEGTPRQSQGTIDLPLIADTGHVRRRLARPDETGRRAITHYQTLEQFGPVASLLACWLETGRTHQIRIHLARIGHPVVGDSTYRPPDQPRTKARFARQALHAQTLGFRHPFTNTQVRVEAPPPDDLASLILDLRNRFGIPNAGG